MIGENTSTTGQGSGVRGTSASFSGSGVKGVNTAGGPGLVGVTDGGASQMYGVIGISTSDGHAIAGSPSTDPNAVGVIGYQNGPDPQDAIFAFGNFSCTGAKAFRIDHPLDPAHKDLFHFCTDGPEPMNAYSGNVRTDARGYATVTLPEYFASINKDFRYQLTVIDGEDRDGFVLVKVARRIEGNTFKIRTSEGGVDVSWRVECTRNDVYMRAHPPKAEREKASKRQGKYYYPELYGEPQAKAVFPLSSRTLTGHMTSP